MFTWFQRILRFNLLPRNNILPGRWHLKYKEKDLDLFYRQIPDPGYPSNYK